jgi:hypothetical protein
MKKWIAVCLIFLLCACTRSKEWILTSPDNRLSIIVSNKTQLSYQVKYKGKKVILPSPLGINREDARFSENLRFKSVSPVVTIDETYTLKSGKRLACRNYAKELTLHFTNEKGDPMQLILRAYDDGIAFRYNFPGGKDTASLYKIVNETTGFALPLEGKAWIHPYDWNERLKPRYEQYCKNEIPIGSASPNEKGWAYPMLFHSDGVWILITEALLDGNYCATHVRNTENGLYTVCFAEKEEIVIADDPEPVSCLPWATPWRVIAVSDTLADIVETNIVQNLNPANVIADTSWIRPGRSSRSWRSDGTTANSCDKLLQYIDFSAAMGWEYTLLDSGWTEMKEGTMEDVAAYAKSKGVGIWLWYHSGGGHENDSLAARNPMVCPKTRKTEFKRLQDIGIKGIKVDFFDTDKQRIVKRYKDILEDAATYHLMVNFHGATLPRGTERTYPHLMTTRAIKGAEEFERQSSYDNAPRHNTTAPFIRNVVGSTDYMPVTFSNKTGMGTKASRITTHAHQLALAVIFESGIQNFSDMAEAYMALPETPETFLKNIPTAWDETKLATGYPGDFVVIARRKGDTWYIGGINGKNEMRTLKFELPFVPDGKEIQLITDGSDMKKFARSTALSGGVIAVDVLPYGGFVGTVINKQYSQLVYSGQDGKLKYRPYTDKGDIIPDFSRCGYKGGGVKIPDIRVVATLQCGNAGDDMPRIQAVIDSVEKLPTDADGFRGVILLKKGVYRLASPLQISAGGIVLRGEGNDKNNGTVLLATSSHKYNVIEVGPDTCLRSLEDTKRQITDDYVPSGTKVVHVFQASSVFKAGDKVVIRRPSVAAWIRATGMDSIPPRPFKGESTLDAINRFRKSNGNTNTNGTIQWQPGSRDLIFERTIISVNGNEITLDIPLTNALQKEYGGGFISKYTFPERITQCGIEDLYGMSVYDENIRQEHSDIGLYCCDEAHANNFVALRAVENAWVRRVNVEHFDGCVTTAPMSKFITGQDLSAVNPVSLVTGGRRYAYSISGQMNLFERCYSSHHRHEFVLGASVAGPNAFVNGCGDMTFASSEPHQRWATGCLYDNITIRGPEGSLLAVNRGWFGSGHGWAGAQIIFWNCSAPVIMVMKPPTAQNFAIGSSGPVTEQQAEKARMTTIRAINNVALGNFEYKGVPALGNGWIEHPDKEVYPKSLYYAQLNDRMSK